MREKPTTESAIIMDMPHGTLVTKIEDASALGWWKISTTAGNLVEEGYAAARFLVSIDPEPAKDTRLTDLTNVMEVIKRVQRFVGDYASSLDEELLRVLNQVVAHYKIGENPRRFSHFMAQLAHESAHFTAMEENLNYSTQGLMKIFPSKFRDDAQEAATPMRANPKRLPIASMRAGSAMVTRHPETDGGIADAALSNSQAAPIIARLAQRIELGSREQ